MDEHAGLPYKDGLYLTVPGENPAAAYQVLDPAAGKAQQDDAYGVQEQRFRIEVQISHPWVGPMLGYSGSFTTSYLGPGQPVPAAVKPLREEIRC